MPGLRPGTPDEYTEAQVGGRIGPSGRVSCRSPRRGKVVLIGTRRADAKETAMSVEATPEQTRWPAPGLEVRSIDHVPLNERHGKLWHLGPLWFMSNSQMARLPRSPASCTGC